MWSVGVDDAEAGVGKRRRQTVLAFATRIVFLGGGDSMGDRDNGDHDTEDDGLHSTPLGKGSSATKMIPKIEKNPPGTR